MIKNKIKSYCLSNNTNIINIDVVKNYDMIFNNGDHIIINKYIVYLDNMLQGYNDNNEEYIFINEMFNKHNILINFKYDNNVLNYILNKIKNIVNNKFNVYNFKYVDDDYDYLVNDNEKCIDRYNYGHLICKLNEINDNIIYDFCLLEQEIYDKYHIVLSYNI